MIKAAIASCALMALALPASAHDAQEAGLHVVPAESLGVWTDPATGCEYLTYDDYRSGRLVPRLDSDGVSIRGCKGSNDDE